MEVAMSQAGKSHSTTPSKSAAAAIVLPIRKPTAINTVIVADELDLAVRDLHVVALAVSGLGHELEVAGADGNQAENVAARLYHVMARIREASDGLSNVDVEATKAALARIQRRE